MKKDRYKVGVLGVANIAVRSLIPAFYNSGRFELAGIASRSLFKANEIANSYNCQAYGSYDELLDNEAIDLVYVPLPTGLHYEWILKALKKGKHVMSEKSLASTWQEVKELTELAEKNNLLLIENFQFRFHSQHQWVREQLKNNAIGDIRCFRSSFGFPPFSDKNNIRYSKNLGGGALLDTGAYTLKAMQTILPEYSFTFRSASLYSSPGFDVELWGGAYLDCEEGITAQLSFGFDNYYQCNYEIWGSKGKIISTRAFTAPANLEPLIILEKQDSKEEIRLPKDDHFKNILLYIAECLDKQKYKEEYQQNLMQAYYIEQIKNYCYGK
ncbi:NDP-hexose-3-ketoreductase [Bacteroidia bacterium]|nr:NDP-hexose-3-ketoreductase [Bacteroidia bacterium]